MRPVPEAFVVLSCLRASAGFTTRPAPLFPSPPPGRSAFGRGGGAAREAIALVAHVLHQPIAELWEMEMDELRAWAGEAAALWKRLYLPRKRP